MGLLLISFGESVLSRDSRPGRSGEGSGSDSEDGVGDLNSNSGVFIRIGLLKKIRFYQFLS